MTVAVLNLPSASGLLTNRAGCLMIHSTRETSGSSTATYRFWDGSTNAGTKLLTVELAAGTSTVDNFYRCVLPFQVGLYYELVSGALEGSVGILLDHDCREYWKHMLVVQLGGQG